MRVRRFVHVVLFIVASILLWQTIGTWRRSLDGQRPNAPQNPSEEKPFPFALSPQLQVGKQYANTIADKDLFVPSRGRAPQEPKAAPAAVPPPSHLKLVGVVLNRGKEEALFADSSQGGKVVRVRKGEALGSYKLVGLAPLQATLTIGPDGEEVSLPLLVIDSGTAGQAQRLMPPQVKGNPPRPGQVAGRQVPPQPPPGRVAVPPPQVSPQRQETRAIRQNIQQLQQRLRQIRRQAARGEGAEEEEGGEEEGAGDDEENEE